jgi:hypothetical protein
MAMHGRPIHSAWIYFSANRSICSEDTPRPTFDLEIEVKTTYTFLKRKDKW